MENLSIKSRIRDALGSLLEPIVLLLLKSGVTWKEFAAIAKSTFVQVATNEFGIRGRPTNLARVAILTGLDRREVKKLREAPSSSETADHGFMSKPTLLLEGWHRDPEFLDRSRKPLDLGFEGEQAQFAILMRRYAPGIPMVAMIKELTAVGAVEKLDTNKLRVLKRTYIPRELRENQIRLWGSALHDHGMTLEANLTHASPEDSRLERRALSLDVDGQALPEFRDFIEAEGQAFLERVDRWLQAHRVPASRKDETRGIRLGVGVYHIQGAVGGVGREQ